MSRQQDILRRAQSDGGQLSTEPEASSPLADGLSTANHWARDLRGATRSLREMVLRAWVPSDIDPAVSQKLKLQVPKVFAESIDQGVSSLARQFVPDARELDLKDYERQDPIGDDKHSPLKGLVHRYPDRALLIPHYHCASYCRFCFRSQKVSHQGALTELELDRVVDYLASHSEISELILTGGDPLVMSDARLQKLIERLNSVPHLKRLRIHTRVLTVLPARITGELIKILRQGRLVPWVVAHINSFDELTEDAESAFVRLADGGIPVLSQSVLLKGVNDSVQALRELYFALLDLRVRPYYLHYLDQARGTSHFRIPLARAKELVDSLRGTLPGYGIPQLIVDIPGGLGKVPPTKPWCQLDPASGEWVFSSPLDPLSVTRLAYDD